jgi:hypothetical protein
MQQAAPDDVARLKDFIREGVEAAKLDDLDIEGFR